MNLESGAWLCFCTVCGKYAENVIRDFAKPCPKRCAGSGPTALRAFGKLRHPRTGELLLNPWSVFETLHSVDGSADQ